MAQTAGATTLLAVDVPALSRTADAIVRGKVVDVASKRSGDGRRVFTEIAIEVAETLKGTPPKRLILVQPGGIVGDLGQHVAGTGSFKRDEEVLVFLEQRGMGRYVLSGMAQGKYRIERSSDGKAAFALPEDAGDSQMIDRLTGLPVQRSTTPLELEELLTQIRAALVTIAPTQPGPTKLPGKVTQ